MTQPKVGDKLTIKEFKARVVLAAEAPLGLSALGEKGFTVVADENGVYHALWIDPTNNHGAPFEVAEHYVDEGVYRDATGEYFQFISDPFVEDAGEWMAFGQEFGYDIHYPQRPLERVDV